MGLGLSKEQQTSHNRIKPKKESTFGKQSKGSFGKKPKKGLKPKSQKNICTKEEREFMEWMKAQDFPCFVCGVVGNNDLHHVKRDSTDSKNNKRLLPICRNHHTGSSEFSVHGTPVKWRETYRMEEQEHFARQYYLKFVKTKI